MKTAPILGTGIQRYANDEDVENVEKSAWFNVGNFEKHFGKILETTNYFDRNSILDVGCGNGRLNTVHKKYFTKITGIDLYREPNPKYMLDNFQFKQVDIFNVDGKFNIILFMGSFYLHYSYGYSETLIRAKMLMEGRGAIVIVEDKKRNTDKNTTLGYYNLNSICNKANLMAKYKFISTETPFSLYILVDSNEGANK